MIKFLIAVTFIASLFITTNSAYAEYPIMAKCDPQKLTALKYSQCLDILKIKVDRELQTWINNQLFILEELAKETGRNSAYDMFERSQNNFETFRDSNCKWQFLAELPSNESAPHYKKCYILTTKDRINELRRIAKT